MTVTIRHGDCLELLPTLPDNSIDAVITDPPYGLGFMGKQWDTPVGYGEFSCTWARECLRVLKPGGHLLAFGGTRTYHRLASGIEDAGFEIRDSIVWLYGSGFPKSHDISKAIDKAAGAQREVLATIPDRWAGKGDVLQRSTQAVRDSADITAPATDEAKQWQGWGTALKPASEPIVVARKPFSGTVASNVLTHGTGALNIDGCRTSSAEKLVRPEIARQDNEVYGKGLGAGTQQEPSGRWPANVVLTHNDCEDGCEPGCPVAELDEQSGDRPGRRNGVMRRGLITGRSIGGDSAYGSAGPHEAIVGYGDNGGASRFFPTFRYQAKAASKERPKVDGVAHPTVKPVALMRWLVKLVTPPGGTVLDPFAGSGTTVEACLLEGLHCTAFEREADYLPLINQRIQRVGGLL